MPRPTVFHQSVLRYTPRHPAIQSDKLTQELWPKYFTGEHFKSRTNSDALEMEPNAHDGEGMERRKGKIEALMQLRVR